MIDLEALKAAGLDNDRLKKVFTAERPKRPGKGKTPDARDKQDPGFSDIKAFQASAKEDWQIREYVEKVILYNLNESMDRNAAQFSIYGAIDMAYEAGGANKLQLPFQKVAQGLINIEQCRQQIEQLSPTTAEALFKKEGGNTVKVNSPRLFEISHNLVHSLVTRRVAAIATPIAQRFPFLKFESRSTTEVGRLRADLMTQRAEIMADQYGYRNDAIQSVRAVSLYGHQVEFKRSAWDREVQMLRKRKRANGASNTGSSAAKAEPVIVREGVEFIAPHPSRVFWDVSEPMSKINTDTGPGFIGYWDLVRLGEIRSNSAYFNTDKIEYDPRVYDYIAGLSEYFSQYYRDRIVTPNTRANANAAAFSLNNDRKYDSEKYAQSNDRATTTIAQYYWRVIPKDLGIGTYKYPVWIRLVVVGNKTVIFAEVVGSAPACYYNYNESDDRLVSPTFAMQAMPYQDQATNLLTQLLEIQQQGLTRIISICTDGMTAEQVKQVERSLTNREYYAAKDVIIKYSLAKIRDRGEDPKIFLEKVRVSEIPTREKVTEIFQSLIQLLAIAERLLFFSPQELGQVAPREVTATEANMVNSTTLGIRDFHGLGIDMGLDAKKRIIYESTVAFGSNEVELPAAERYDRAVVEAEGWTVLDDGLGAQAQGNTFTLSGRRDGLVHDYVFTSRDGFDRPLPSAEATALVTAMDVAARDQGLQGIMTWGQKIDLYNELIRKISGVNLRLQVPPGVDRDKPIGGGPQLEQIVQTLGQAVQQLAAGQQKSDQGLQQLAGMLAGLAKSVEAMASSSQKVATREGEVAPGIPRGAPAARPAAPAEIRLRLDEPRRRTKRSIVIRHDTEGNATADLIEDEAPAAPA